MRQRAAIDFRFASVSFAYWHLRDILEAWAHNSSRVEWGWLFRLLSSIFTDLLAKFSHLSSNFHPTSRDILLIIGMELGWVGWGFLSRTNFHLLPLLSLCVITERSGTRRFSPKMLMQFSFESAPHAIGIVVGAGSSHCSKAARRREAEWKVLLQFCIETRQFLGIC